MFDTHYIVYNLIMRVFDHYIYRQSHSEVPLPSPAVQIVFGARLVSGGWCGGSGTNAQGHTLGAAEAPLHLALARDAPCDTVRRALDAVAVLA